MPIPTYANNDREIQIGDKVKALSYDTSIVVGKVTGIHIYEHHTDIEINGANGYDSDAVSWAPDPVSWQVPAEHQETLAQLIWEASDSVSGRISESANALMAANPDFYKQFKLY